MAHQPPQPDAIRHGYEAHGVDGFYQHQGATYRNPHEPVVAALIRQVVDDRQIDLSNVLDLACGSGEATLALRACGATVHGIDPYTGAAFAERTGAVAEALLFEDIANGALGNRAYSAIVCSFALHLVETSRLPMVCLHLAQISPVLLVLTPHKRPDVRREWGWQLVAERLHERVRARLYHSTISCQTLSHNHVAVDRSDDILDAR